MHWTQKLKVRVKVKVKVVRLRLGLGLDTRFNKSDVFKSLKTSGLGVVALVVSWYSSLFYDQAVFGSNPTKCSINIFDQYFFRNYCKLKVGGNSNGHFYTFHVLWTTFNYYIPNYLHILLGCLKCIWLPLIVLHSTMVYKYLHSNSLMILFQRFNSQIIKLYVE